MNTLFKMATSFPGSLKAEQDVNFARFAMHALLPEEPGKFDFNTDTRGRGNF